MKRYACVVAAFILLAPGVVLAEPPHSPGNTPQVAIPASALSDQLQDCATLVDTGSIKSESLGMPYYNGRQR